MSQVDVYDLLKTKRKKSEAFFTTKEVQDFLRDKISLGSLWGVPSDLLRLESAGYLEAELRFYNYGRPIRSFRLKRKYL